MCIIKNRFNSIKREDVVNAICELQKDEQAVEEDITIYSNNIEKLIEEGKNTPDKLQRIIYVKKISYLMDDRNKLVKRALFLLYNIKLSNNLKNAIDENELTKRIRGMYITQCLTDQKQLAVYLNKVLNTKIKTEDVLTTADDTFVTVENMYKDNFKIYGVSDIREDKLLALFELDDYEKEQSTTPEEKI